MVNNTVIDLTFLRTAELPLITAITADKNRSVNKKWQPLTENRFEVTYIGYEIVCV